MKENDKLTREDFIKAVGHIIGYGVLTYGFLHGAEFVTRNKIGTWEGDYCPQTGCTAEGPRHEDGPLFEGDNTCPPEIEVGRKSDIFPNSKTYVLQPDTCSTAR